MNRKRYIFIVLIVLILGVLVFFRLYNPISQELNAMVESSAATAQLTTGHELSRRYQDRNTKPLFGKPDRPEVRIEYEPINNYTKEDLYDEIITILDETNWEREELSIAQSGYFRAILPQDGFSIITEVLIHAESNIVSIHLGTVPR